MSNLPRPGSGSSSPASGSPAGTPTNAGRSRRLGIGALSLADTIKKKGEDELDHSNYAIMRQLGSGAFSAVWYARSGLERSAARRSPRGAGWGTTATPTRRSPSRRSSTSSAPLATRGADPRL